MSTEVGVSLVQILLVGLRSLAPLLKALLVFTKVHRRIGRRSLEEELNHFGVVNGHLSRV